MKNSEGEWTKELAIERAEHERQMHEEMMAHEELLKQEESERLVSNHQPGKT